ncbi:hypothetical protein [Bacillus sp. T33-2]|uniref:hypothetical protein n=1 Tax=Bacillus sp. T33-2 TaxID=2054168 RepID=UPI000C76FB6D|nr:hypothetical protein [Bacillus sp. T33-2]PLR91672.1 hypothetical protein CVD19_21550 [Bacillus sp. T33-2]
MRNLQGTTASLPYPSRWAIHAAIAGRPVVYGTLVIDAISNNRVTGTVNFRGRRIPITGFWDERNKQIRFDSPYASYAGNLAIFDDPQIRVRHFMLRGRIVMKPPSLQAGEYGSWIATTDTVLTGPPLSTQGLPPVGAFLTSELMYGVPQ